MTFAKALALIQSGQAVRRSAWHQGQIRLIWGRTATGEGPIIIEQRNDRERGLIELQLQYHPAWPDWAAADWEEVAL